MRSDAGSVGVPAASALAARLALRRVNISPLGVTRRVTPGSLRAWRVLPLLVGLAELGFVVVYGKPASPGAQVLVYVPGFALIMIGLILAGPWLTMAGARIMARSASRPGTLIAARRLADDPRARSGRSAAWSWPCSSSPWPPRCSPPRTPSTSR